MVLERVWRGIHPTRAGEVVWVPAGYNFLDGGISHAVPWPYMQRVPMVWYGPGVIRAQGRVNRWVTAADVAPTLARLVGFDFEAPDGEPMEEILEPGAEPPRLVVVFVWDGSGRYVLDLWPRAWPNLRSLLSLGTSFENATAGSSPPTTAPIHSTLGTGAFPRLHGVLDNWIRFDDGRVADPWSRGPAGLLLPTVADQYEEVAAQRPLIGTFATLAWHLGMMGHGTQYSSSSRQIAVLRQSGADTGAEGVEWGLPGSQEDYFRFPEYVRDLPPISSYFRDVDASDGTVDGKWMGHEFEELKSGFHTPARVPYQGRAIEEVILREGFGQDEVPDLLFLNSKLIDEIGHLFTASAPEMGAAIRAQDAGLPRFIDYLNRQVGEGRWAMLLTADHGHTAHPDVTGATRIKVSVLEDRFAALFGDEPVVERVRTAWMFVDQAKLRRLGHDLTGLAAYVADLTQGEVVQDLTTVPQSERDKRAFAAALPSRTVGSLR
jgi:predicted AlkP superfamily pyrophosphatase or phosphodiesterase